MSHKASKSKKVILNTFEEDYGMESDDEDTDYETGGECTDEDDERNSDEEEENLSDSEDDVEESESDSDSDGDEENPVETERKRILYEKVLKSVQSRDLQYLQEEYGEMVSVAKKVFKDAAGSEWVDQIFLALKGCVYTENEMVKNSSSETVACFFCGKFLKDGHIRSRCFKKKTLNKSNLLCRVEMFHPSDGRFLRVNSTDLEESDVLEIEYHPIFFPLLSSITNIHDALDDESLWYEKYTSEQISCTFVKAVDHIKKCFEAMA